MVSPYVFKPFVKNPKQVEPHSLKLQNNLKHEHVFNLFLNMLKP
jgi:hypothetical protein